MKHCKFQQDQKGLSLKGHALRELGSYMLAISQEPRQLKPGSGTVAIKGIFDNSTGTRFLLRGVHPLSGQSGVRRDTVSAIAGHIARNYKK